MTVWLITNDLIDKVETIVLPPEAEGDADLLMQVGGEGKPVVWNEPLRLVRDKGDSRRKTPKPRTDLTPFLFGVLVLNQKARNALGSFLSRFGQLLEIDVEGETEYYYNVTNVVSCIDPKRSKRRASGAIQEEAFNTSAVPSEPAVFKDPLTVTGRIYVNDGGKALLEQQIKAHGITGMDFARAGL
ncbi:hypothetical protein [Dyella nitratireducens]|uniref:Uncharacterized protein n=1 Tax=Dyella nitratireducens TaxID=1849580 RepID=A0ABQ1G5Y4_9GAMM|nr:hypothetical protein [Dyella nitratireducens]GGA37404.1 hypothetical protein GCM10010981_28190 [Dyella nitratireducens]GLQ41197.1 hypothetical protein GCM10007902_10470 [Dyella nitratireducens]